MTAAVHVPRVLAIDAGGTMTDTFIVDDEGANVSHGGVRRSPGPGPS